MSIHHLEKTMKQIYFGRKLKMSGITKEIRYICTTQKTRLLITTLMVISLIAIFPPFVNSLVIEFNYPSEVELNQEFKTSIDFETNDTYGVKIFVHNSPDSKVTRDEYISDIYDLEKNSWQDSWNYIPANYPKEKEYSLKVTNSPGDRQICARVRKTGSSTSFSKCGSIKVAGVENAPASNSNNANSGDNQITAQNNNQNPAQTNAQNDINNNEEDNNVQNSKQSTQKNSVYNDLSYNEIVTESPEQKNDIIYLNPTKSNESEQSVELTTKKGKTLFIMFYAFSFIGVLILVMLILKKL